MEEETQADGRAAPAWVVGYFQEGVLSEDRFYIDCEFDGHGGPLLSFAIVAEDGRGMHYRVRDVSPCDPWVVENVMPLMGQHEATEGHVGVLNSVGWALREFIGANESPIIVADSPVDISRFCQAISTGDDGGWVSTDYPLLRFEVHNVDCWPNDLVGGVQHNAWWDAMALRHKLADAPGENHAD